MFKWIAVMMEQEMRVPLGVSVKEVVGLLYDEHCFKRKQNPYLG